MGGIDRQKIIIVYNSDNPASEEVADYYIGRRLLNPDNKIGFPFSGYKTIDCTFSSTIYEDVMVPLAAKIKEIGAQVVLTSAFTPSKGELEIIFDEGIRDKKHCFATLLAWSRFYVDVVGNVPSHDGACTDSVGYDYCDRNPNIGQPDNYFWEKYSLLPDGYCYTDWQETYDPFSGNTFQQLVPYDNPNLSYGDPLVVANPWWCMAGRIGIISDGLYNETKEDVIRCIDEAIANEKTFAEVDANNPIHFGAHDRPNAYPYFTGYHMGLIRQEAIAKGLTTVWYEGLYDVNYEYQPVDKAYDAEDMIGAVNINTCIVGIGPLGTPQKLWGHIDQCVCNVAITVAGDATSWPASYDIQAGAWAHYQTSNGAKPAITFLSNGGCAAIGTVAEPSSSGVADCTGVMRELLKGRTMMEANHYGTVGSSQKYSLAFGDPLYAPFGKEFD